MKPFYIVVRPVGSKFAKAIQGAIRSIINQRVLRVFNKRISRQNFEVTPHVLNKIEQFRAFERDGVASPAYCLTPNNVASLGGKTVFARTLINATNGRGIVEFEQGSPPPLAPLYTAYIPKKAEYRAHVFGDKVVHVQQKKKKRGYENDRDTRIRNMANGYVYCTDDIVPPTDLEPLAVAAVKAVGYSYGAVDIIYNEKQNKCFVLEVNSRPGLMGTTVEKYANAIVHMFNLPRK